MGLKQRRNWRKLSANDLVLEFNRIVPNAHVMKGRDSSFIKRTMETNALDAVDILWAITRYSGARDIPSFCRWIARNTEMFDADRLAREGELAATITHQRLPIQTLAYYDLMYESIPDARLERAFRDSRSALEAYVSQVLG